MKTLSQSKEGTARRRSEAARREGGDAGPGQGGREGGGKGKDVTGVRLLELVETTAFRSAGMSFES